MSQRLNLKNDIMFKAFFGKKGNEKYLKEFLESLLKIHIEKIDIRSEVSLLKLDEKEKGGRLDLEAKLNDGLIINIEMQLRNLENMEKRTMYYASKILSREVEKGEKYEKINPIIMVNILDYEIFGFKEYIQKTEIVLKEHKDYEAIKGMQWYFIELPKFRTSNPDMEDKVNQWLALIDSEDRGLLKMAEEKNKVIKEAKKEVEYLTGDEEVKRLAELREKWEMDRNSEIGQAKKEGKIEEKLEIAKSMLTKKFKEEDITAITGLSKEEIEKIKRET